MYFSYQLGGRVRKGSHRSQGSKIRGAVGWSPVPWIQQYQLCESPRVEHPPDPS